jgi:hypothetical protein
VADSSGSTPLSQFVVALGYVTDEASERRFNEAIYNATLKAKLFGDALQEVATKAFSALSETSHGFQELYWQAQNLNIAPQTITAWSQAFGELTGNAGQAQEVITQVAAAIRKSPGYADYMKPLGLEVDKVTGQIKAFHAEWQKGQGLPPGMRGIQQDIAGLTPAMARAVMENRLKLAGLSNPDLFAPMFSPHGADQLEGKMNERLKFFQAGGFDFDQMSKNAQTFQSNWQGVMDNVQTATQGWIDRLEQVANKYLPALKQWSQDNPDLLKVLVGGSAIVGLRGGVPLALRLLGFGGFATASKAQVAAAATQIKAAEMQLAAAGKGGAGGGAGALSGVGGWLSAIGNALRLGPVLGAVVNAQDQIASGDANKEYEKAKAAGKNVPIGNPFSGWGTAIGHFFDWIGMPVPNAAKPDEPAPAPPLSPPEPVAVPKPSWNPVTAAEEALRRALAPAAPEATEQASEEARESARAKALSSMPAPQPPEPEPQGWLERLKKRLHLSEASDGSLQPASYESGDEQLRQEDGKTNILVNGVPVNTGNPLPVTFTTQPGAPGAVGDGGGGAGAPGGSRSSGVGSSGLGPGHGGAGGGAVDPSAAKVSDGSFMDALARIESGNRNIHSGVDPDPPGFPGGNSQGYFQINTPTWQDFRKGTRGENYPNAMSAPRDVQAEVASKIPLARFGPRTRNMLMGEFGRMDTHETIGALAATHGSHPAPPPSAPPAPSASAAPKAKDDSAGVKLKPGEYIGHDSAGRRILIGPDGHAERYLDPPKPTELPHKAGEQYTGLESRFQVHPDHLRRPWPEMFQMAQAHVHEKGEVSHHMAQNNTINVHGSGSPEIVAHQVASKLERNATDVAAQLKGVLTG